MSVVGPHLQTGVPSVLLCKTCSPGLFYPGWIYGVLGHKEAFCLWPLGLLLEVRIRWVGTSLFSFGSCAGVYCSTKRFHLVHTPNSFLAGSTSLEKENK